MSLDYDCLAASFCYVGAVSTALSCANPRLRQQLFIVANSPATARHSNFHPTWLRPVCKPVNNHTPVAFKTELVAAEQLPGCCTHVRCSAVGSARAGLTLSITKLTLLDAEALVQPLFFDGSHKFCLGAGGAVKQANCGRNGVILRSVVKLAVKSSETTVSVCRHCASVQCVPCVPCVPCVMCVPCVQCVHRVCRLPHLAISSWYKAI